MPARHGVTTHSRCPVGGFERGPADVTMAARIPTGKGAAMGADVFTADNAFTVFEFPVREDGGMQGPFFGIHPERKEL
jgi:hypothetical protein